MNHKNRSDFVIYLLRKYPDSYINFEQLALLYQDEYPTSQTVANRSLRMVLRRLESLKKVAISGGKDHEIITLLRNNKDPHYPCGNYISDASFLPWDAWTDEKPFPAPAKTGSPGG